MSPPLSQESLASFAEPEPKPEFSQPQQHLHDHYQQQQSVHPLDQASPTFPKKTLNWVNALPSHFDTESSGHPRKRRRRTNREELEILEDAFAKNLLPDAATRQELGERLGMSVRAVQIWFQNRRQTLRKKSVSHPGGSEEEMSRSDVESRRDSPRRRSSGDSIISSSSPVLGPVSGGGSGQIAKSKSCSNLLAFPPPLPSQTGSQTLLRAETCSSLPTTVSALPSAPKASPAVRSAPPPPDARPLSAKQESNPEEMPQEEQPEVGSEVKVKAEVVESSPSEVLEAAAAAECVQDIVDIKTADLHLCMLLEEAKKRSGQVAAPVMGLWPARSSKHVLNPTCPGSFPPTTTTFPTPKRTMSTPSMRPSSSNHSHRPPSAVQQHSRSSTKTARKHRSMPEAGAFAGSLSSCSPYSRTVSLMEQVLNRQPHHHHHCHQQQHHHRPAPSNFKQSALSGATKHTIDSVSHRTLQTSSPISSTGLSPAQLARRLQYVVSSNLKRVQSESVLLERQHSNNTNNTNTNSNSSSGRCGQPAMRARRLSFGKFLFDSDTDEEIWDKSRLSLTNQQQELTHQAQKRRAGTPATPTATIRDQSVDGDETDEEDFRALVNQRTMKRFNLSKALKSSPSASPSPSQRQQDWSGTHKVPRKSLKSSLSTLSLATSSPTREYALELERSRSPLTSYPILERNRTWSPATSGTAATVEQIGSGTMVQESATTEGSSTETKDLNMDELECASVLAGLGWSR
ncbi:hypothetical protein BGZ54_003434 [Gamsiella multidivaricata]|nr:hypothetical protein BGZ54_003434 [Gamsiella multidivaricata]